MSDTNITILWQSITLVHEPLRVVDRARLLEQPDACVQVGTAPDGLPLVLRVRRSASIVEPVLRAVHAAELNDLSSEARKLLLDLNKRMQLERRSLGIAARGPASTAPHYLSMQSVPSLFGETLLCRLLGAASPLLLPEDRAALAGGVDDLAARTSCGVLKSALERVELTQQLDLRQHLAIPLDDGPVHVVRRCDQRSVDVSEGRPLVLEDLRHVPSAMFHTYRREEGLIHHAQFQGRLGDDHEYRAAIRDAHGVGWSLSRMDLLAAIAEVARALTSLHQEGLVHGDLKPANILLTAQGALPHDSLDVPVGTISAAGTKGWNAPEQVIAREVSPATDVFALAQLVVQVLEAAVFGDERSYVVPIGRGERLRERLLPEPDVYLDPTLIPFDDSAIAAWRGFLRRCLALDASKRVQTSAAFADELCSIAARHPVPGRRAVSGMAGRLTRHAEGEGLGDRLRRLAGKEGAGPVWEMQDSYSHLHRMPWRVVFGLAA